MTLLPRPDETSNPVTSGTPRSMNDPADFADAMASARVGQSSAPPIRLAQATIPMAPAGAGPFPIVPGIMPGSYENNEWSKHAINGLKRLFHSASPATSNAADQLNRVTSSPAVDDARQKQIDQARQQWSTGQKITPPGFCPDEEHNRLTSAVDRLCKSGHVQACSPTDPDQVLRAKGVAFKQCALARTEREDQCYKGGDGGHRMQIQQMWKGFDKCQTFLGLTP